MLAFASSRALALSLLLTACTGSEAPQPESRTPDPEVPPPIAAPPEPAPPVDPIAAPWPAGSQVLHPSTPIADLHGLTGDALGNLVAVGTGGTIVRSGDRGRTWQVMTSGTRANLAAAWADAEGRVYAVGDAGTIVRSLDRGLTWQTVASGTQASLLHVVGNPRELYIGGETGTLLRSRDAGATWQAQPMPAPPPAPPDPPLSRMRPPRDQPRDLPPREPDEAEQIRRLHRPDATIRGLGTTRPGELWLLLDHLLWVRRTADAPWQLAGRTRPPRDRFAHLHVDSTGVYITGRNLRERAEDSFLALAPGGDAIHIERWHDLRTRLISPPQVITAGPAIVLAGDGYGVYGSSDRGLTWFASEQSAAMQSPYSLAKRALWAAPDGVVYAAGSNGALMRSSDRGATWSLLVDGAREPLWGGALGPDGGTIYAAVAHAVLRGRDGVWDLRSPGMKLPIGGGAQADTERGLVACCTDVWVAPDGAIVAVGEGGIWRSADDGRTWSRRRDDDTPCCWSLWGDARGVHGVSRDLVLTSQDGGKSWKRRSIADLLTRDDGNRLDITGADDHLYVVGGQGIVLHSPDRGKTWTRQNSGTREYLYAGYVGRSGPGHTALAVGEHGTILRSTDGARWHKLDTGLTTRLTGVHGDPTRAKLYIAGEAGLLESHDDGQTWTPILPAHRNLRHVFGDGRGHVYALGDSGVVLQVP